MGNEKIFFKGNQSFIAFGNSADKVAWSIEQITPNGFKTEHLTDSRITRITNAVQNSAALIESNSQIRIAEIYSFYPGYIDASIAIKNLNTHNATYIATFVVTTNHRDQVSTFGFSGGSINLPTSQKTVFVPISSQSWIYGDHNIQISWKSEMSLFHAGILMSDTRNNVISLPFGPFTLSSNETTSIDPVIRPDRLPGGGGGSGGGGSSGSPPTASISLLGVSSNTNTFGAGTELTISADVSSMGSYNPDGTTYVTMDFYALTSGGDQTFLFQKTVTSTGTYDYKWSAVPGFYTGVKMEYGGYWGPGTPSQVNQVIKVYDILSISGSNSYPTDAATTSRLYDSSSNVIGYQTIQVESAQNTPWSGGSSITFLFESSFVNGSSTSIAVSNFTQHVIWDGNSIGSSGTYVYQSVTSMDDGAQTNVSNDWGPAEYALWSALTVLLAQYSLGGSAIMAAIGVLLFQSMSFSPYAQNNILNVNGNPSIDQLYLNTGGLSETPDFIFNFYDGISYLVGAPTSSTSSNAVLNYFTYSSSMKIIVGDLAEPKYDSYYTSSVSIPLYLGQYY